MRGNRAIRCGLVALVVFAAVAALPGDALARKRHSSQWTQLQRKIRETQDHIAAARARERGIVAQINASDMRRRQLEDTLEGLTGQLMDANSRLDALEAAVGAAQIQLELRNQDLEQTLGALADQQTLLSKRAAESYMTGPMAFAPVLFNTEDFHSFASAEQYVSSVLDRDAGVLDDIKSIRSEIETDRAAIGRRKSALQAQADIVHQEEQRIAQIRWEQKQARDAVVGEINYRRKLLERVQNEREAYEEALRSLQEESDSIAGILRGAEAGQKVVAGAGHGYVVWPVTGEITSPYGWRIHPIYHRRSFHTGIDIGSHEGAPVVAARAGEVIFTGYKGAYGLIVLIEHGDGVATLYAHLSQTYVRAGDKVKKRETIAAVGCTGWCTGPHLHFEVRSQGEPTNPMRWL